MGKSSAPLITAEDVYARIVKSNCFGGGTAVSLSSRSNTLVVTVEDNSTVMNIPPKAVGLPEERVRVAKSYAEAAGLLATHKAGIDLDSISPTVPRIRWQEQLTQVNVPLKFLTPI